MTLDEAIKHTEEVAEEQNKLFRLCPSEYNCDGLTNCSALKNGKDKGCLKCAEEHRQLAEWLKDYKRLKQEEKYTTDVNISEMMHEIYMEGVNMGGEYQGCWVRYRDIERIVNKYFQENKE